MLLGDDYEMGARRLWDVLPVGICDLEVWTHQAWSGGEVVQELVALVERKEEVPGLRRGAFEWDHGTPDSLRHRLTSACKVANVELVSQGSFKLVGVGGD